MHGSKQSLDDELFRSELSVVLRKRSTAENAGVDNPAFVDQSPSRNNSNSDDVFSKSHDKEHNLRRESDIGTDVDNAFVETNSDEKDKNDVEVSVSNTFKTVIDVKST